MLSPLTWLLVSLPLIVLGLAWRGRTRAFLRFGTGLAVLATAAMTPWAANALVRWLEAPQPVSASCHAAPPSTAVVLASGLDSPPGGTVTAADLDLASRRRIEHAAAWWRAGVDRTVVVSGGPQRGRVATSRLMAGHAAAIGLPADALRTEERSDTTWSSARALASLEPALPRHVVLVTSAMHMRRARYAMEQAGFTVCPLPTDARFVPFALPGYVLPGSSALMKTESALHEVAGLAYYRWLRWREPGAG